MKRLLIRDPITHEPLGVLLTTNPDLWECYAPDPEPEPDPRGYAPEHDTSWAELFGIEED
jgi:hypothetical protein